MPSEAAGFPSDSSLRLAVLLNTAVPGMRSKDALYHFQAIDQYLTIADMPLRQQILMGASLNREVAPP